MAANVRDGHLYSPSAYEVRDADPRVLTPNLFNTCWQKWVPQCSDPTRCVPFTQPFIERTTHDIGRRWRLQSALEGLHGSGPGLRGYAPASLGPVQPQSDAKIHACDRGGKGAETPAIGV
jgi:hypothetical protein